MTMTIPLQRFAAVAGTALLVGLAGCGEKKSAPKESKPARTTPPKAPEAVIDLDTPLRVVAKVKQVSKIPEPAAMDYDDLITTVKFDVEKIEKGTYDKKEILVQLLAIRDRKRLPAASLAKGQRVQLYLLPWKKTAEQIKSVQQVDDIADDALLPYFAAAHVVLGTPQKDRDKAAADERQKAIRATQKALGEELKKYGEGSYDNWLSSLSDFYEDIKKQGEAITKETARKGEFGQYKKHNLSVYKSLYKELLSVPLGEHPALPQIVDFANALKKKGIDLIYLSIPRPQLMYPDYIADVPLKHIMVAPRYREQLRYLLNNGVEVIDTVPFILANREGDFGRMYTIKSHHPTNAWMRRFADMAAERLERYGLTNGRYEVMIDKAVAPDHDTEVKQTQFPDGTPYTDAERSPVLVIGDSTIRLNWPSKSAGFSGHLAKDIGIRTKMVQRNSFSLSALAKEGADLLDGVKVVVWVQWSLFLGKPHAVPNWWKHPIDWSKTRAFGS